MGLCKGCKRKVLLLFNVEAPCRYTSASKEVKDILREYDMAASSYSLDEAFLDVADYCEAKGMTGELNTFL